MSSTQGFNLVSINHRIFWKHCSWNSHWNMILIFSCVILLFALHNSYKFWRCLNYSLGTKMLSSQNVSDDHINFETRIFNVKKTNKGYLNTKHAQLMQSALPKFLPEFSNKMIINKNSDCLLMIISDYIQSLFIQVFC